MTKFPCSTLLLLLLSLVAGTASASEYAITIGEAVTGSAIARNKVSLGIRVDIDKDWAGLAEKDQQVWREFTELLDPQVTPPFPLPNIRGFLRKLAVPDKYNTTENIAREDGITLVVHVSEAGDVSSVDIMEGTVAGTKELNAGESLLAYRYIKALMATRFSPAMFQGKPAPSAFPMCIRLTTKML